MLKGPYRPASTDVRGLPSPPRPIPQSTVDRPAAHDGEPPAPILNRRLEMSPEPSSPCRRSLPSHPGWRDREPERDFSALPSQSSPPQCTPPTVRRQQPHVHHPNQTRLFNQLVGQWNSWHTLNNCSSPCVRISRVMVWKRPAPLPKSTTRSRP